MNPISAWTATAQDSLQRGDILFEKSLQEYRITAILSDYCLWFVAEWQNGGRVAFRAAYAANDRLAVSQIRDEENELMISLTGSTGRIRIRLRFPDLSQAIFRYETTLIPAFDMLIPYWPRDIMPLFKEEGRVQNTSGTMHASQIGTRSGNLFFSINRPETGSVFYFQNLTALNKYCQDTESSAGDLVGGTWPEIGMKLPPTKVEKPLLRDQEYVISDAFVLLTEDIPQDNYEMSIAYMESLAAVYPFLPRPETRYQDWIGILEKGLKDLQGHKGCWQFAEGHSYLNAYVSDYETPPESMVQLAVLLPLTDYDKWSGEEHSELIDTLRLGLENFYDKSLGTLTRWLPSLEKKLDYGEEQKRPDVMDSWYLHHPLLNLARLARDGDKLAEGLLMDSIEYVIRVAKHFDYKWPVFYKMATLEVLKAETSEGMGGEKDVAGAYAHLMIQVWQLTQDKRYFNEAVRAARTLDGMGFDIFYQANNTSFAAGALLRLYKETGDQVFLKLSLLCVASILKNVQLWECDYGNGKHYPTFFAVYPLKDAPYTAAYEEQEVFAGIHSFLNEAEGVEEVPASVRMLLAECVKYIINRVSYYYPPLLPAEVLARPEDVKTGEIDSSLWIALEDLQDGWNPSGQVGQEVYGAGLSFGIVPRQYYKVEEAGFMIFTDYPATGFRRNGNSIGYYSRGDQRLEYRMLLMPLEGIKKMPKLTVKVGTGSKATIVSRLSAGNEGHSEYVIPGDSRVRIEW